LNGIICPGHVSAVIGSRPYQFLAKDYHIACAVAGFEPVDILLAVDLLVEQIESGEPRVEIAYKRGVKEEGNPAALKLMDTVFEVGEAEWRGIGAVPASGLKLRNQYERYDATKRFDIKVTPAKEPKGCICGAVLRGVSTPDDCKLFRKTCTPENPIGPCMVSAEGACAAYYEYGETGKSELKSQSSKP
jgi:hydrogenase expression/formation protein HypD